MTTGVMPAHSAPYFPSTPIGLAEAEVYSRMTASAVKEERTIFFIVTPEQNAIALVEVAAFGGPIENPMD